MYDYFIALGLLRSPTVLFSSSFSYQKWKFWCLAKSFTSTPFNSGKERKQQIWQYFGALPVVKCDPPPWVSLVFAYFNSARPSYQTQT